MIRKASRFRQHSPSFCPGLESGISPDDCTRVPAGRSAGNYTVQSSTWKCLLSLVALMMLVYPAYGLGQSSTNPGDDALHWAYAEKCEGQAAANVCAGHELDLKQTEMAELIGKEHDKLDGFSQAQQHLAVAQAAWEKFARAECTFEAGEPGPDSGTGYPERWARCMQAVVQTRIGQVKGYLACQHDGCWPKP